MCQHTKGRWKSKTKYFSEWIDIVWKMSQEYNLHFIHGAKTKKNLSCSVVIVLNLFFLWTVLSSGWRIFNKSDINKIGNVFENKRIKDPIHDFCWPYTWVCKFLSWILLKNNMRSMSYGQFSRAGSQKGEFFTPSTTSPIRGKREFDANESGEHIELFDISWRNKLCSRFDQTFSSSFNWIKNLFFFFFFNLNVPFSHRE